MTASDQQQRLQAIRDDNEYYKQNSIIRAKYNVEDVDCLLTLLDAARQEADNRLDRVYREARRAERKQVLTDVIARIEAVHNAREMHKLLGKLESEASDDDA